MDFDEYKGAHWVEGSSEKSRPKLDIDYMYRAMNTPLLIPRSKKKKKREMLTKYVEGLCRQIWIMDGSEALTKIFEG